MGGTRNKLLRSVTLKMIDLIAEEMDNEETQMVIKDKIITPLLKVIFKETNRYLYGLVLLICLTMLFSMLTLVMFAMSSRSPKK